MKACSSVLFVHGNCKYPLTEQKVIISQKLCHSRIHVFKETKNLFEANSCM